MKEEQTIRKLELMGLEELDFLRIYLETKIFVDKFDSPSMPKSKDERLLNLVEQEIDSRHEGVIF